MPSTLLYDFPHTGVQVRRFPSGNVVQVNADGTVTPVSDDDLADLDEHYEGPTCSLCDGLGHGYPGGGPCPLEERGWAEAEADRLRYGAF